MLCSARRPGDANGGQPRVLVSGMPIATIAAPYLVAGCVFAPPAGNGPCVTGAMDPGRRVQVTSEGQPVVIITGMAMCAADRHAAACRFRLKRSPSQPER